MSTKIYDGFVIENKTLEQLHKQIMVYRQEVIALTQQELSEYIGGLVAYHLDEITMGIKKDKSKHSILSGKNVFMKDQEADCRAKGMRSHLYDFSCEISLIPLKANKILGIIYTKRESFKDLWFNKSFVKEYSYWNNTDKPDEITGKEWAQRDRVWGRALCGTPAMSGYNATCNNEYLPFIDFEDIKKWPTFAYRVNDISDTIVSNKWIESFKHKGLGLGEYFVKLQEYKKTDSYKNI